MKTKIFVLLVPLFFWAFVFLGSPLAYAEPTPTPTTSGQQQGNPGGSGQQQGNPGGSGQQQGTPTPTTTVVPSGTGNTNSNDSCTFDSTGTKLCNPIPSKTLTDLVISLTKSFLSILAIFAVGFIVFGGFRLVMSQGNEAAVKSAKGTITYAIVGLVVALLAYSIVSIVLNLIKGNV